MWGGSAIPKSLPSFFGYDALEMQLLPCEDQGSFLMTKTSNFIFFIGKIYQKRRLYTIFFINKYFLKFLFIYLCHRQSEWGRESKRESQAVFTLGTELHTGLDHTTVRTWPEPTSIVRSSTNWATQLLPQIFWYIICNNISKTTLLQQIFCLILCCF